MTRESQLSGDVRVAGVSGGGSMASEKAWGHMGWRALSAGSCRHSLASRREEQEAQASIAHATQHKRGMCDVHVGYY